MRKYYTVFDYGNKRVGFAPYKTSTFSTSTLAAGKDCAAATETAKGRQFHCDQSKDGEAVMCITGDMPPVYGGNRCCDGAWLFGAEAAIEKHGFTTDAANAWAKNCDQDPT